MFGDFSNYQTITSANQTNDTMIRLWMLLVKSRKLPFHNIQSKSVKYHGCKITVSHFISIPGVDYEELTLSQCTLAGPVYTGMPLDDPVYTGIPLGHPANTCRVHWNTTRKT